MIFTTNEGLRHRLIDLVYEIVAQWFHWISTDNCDHYIRRAAIVTVNCGCSEIQGVVSTLVMLVRASGGRGSDILSAHQPGEY